MMSTEAEAEAEAEVGVKVTSVDLMLPMLLL
jgi:hypothetical protein